MEKPPRRELPTSCIQSDAPILHAQQPHFFNQERLCQYVPWSQQQSGQPASSIDGFRRILTKLLWPRLVVIRTRHVLVALMPLLNLAQDGTIGGVLDAASSVLSPLGWVLHGIRLLINTVQLLQRLIEEDQPLAYLIRVDKQLKSTGTEIGNDLIWIFAALAPASVSFTMAFFLVDIVWLVVLAGIEIKRLTHLRDDIDPTLINGRERLTQAIGLEQKKFILNLINLVSITAIVIMKTYILPMFAPVLATNPVLLLVFAALSLAITILTHVLGQQLVCEQQFEVPVSEEQGMSSGKKTQMGFFKNPNHLDGQWEVNVGLSPNA